MPHAKVKKGVRESAVLNKEWSGELYAEDKGWRQEPINN